MSTDGDAKRKHSTETFIAGQGNNNNKKLVGIKEEAMTTQKTSYNRGVSKASVLTAMRSLALGIDARRP